ncbi:MAG: oligosaccharide flippase family protein [Ignavibacteria bacterium]|jgi:O-antigen/teichoic acid export membrane protein|nr:oligosaccharide flippase family protein [Ignavibacteria bacterium]MCU7503728.1 oligosaccharide flippase family protein [Ignavibacteria bacterium]MCU7517626.1 oligosaccharide flippase family protein [Ignavibacteria bacterium]
MKINKAVSFTGARYLTYGLQFLRGILFAKMLGPTLFGLWGVITLVQQYLTYSNFGINYSVNVELSLNENNEKNQSEIVSSGIFLTMLFSAAILLILFLPLDYKKYLFDGYNIEYLLIPILLSSVLSNFTILFSNIFRCYEKLFIIVFDEFISILFPFILIFFFTDYALIKYAIWSLFFAKLISLSAYLYYNPVKIIFKIGLNRILFIIKSGISLLLYNASFYFIMISGRTIVGVFYSSKEMGLYTLAYNLATATFLGLSATTYVYYPKILKALEPSKPLEERINNFCLIEKINNTFVYSIIFLASCILPFIFIIIPDYTEILNTLNYLLLSQAILASCLTANSLLVASHKQNYVAIGGILAVSISVIFGVIISQNHLSFNIISLVIFISCVIYFLYVQKMAFSLLKLHTFSLFDAKIIIPVILFLILNMINYEKIAGLLALTTYLIINYRSLNDTYLSIKRVLFQNI